MRHFAAFSRSRHSCACLSLSRAACSCLTASCVNVRRQKVRSASVAHSVSRFEVLSMTACSSPPNRGFKRVDGEFFL